MMLIDAITSFLTAYKREVPSYSQYLALFNELKGTSAAQSGLPALRVAVLRNFTVEPLLPVLAGEIVRSGAAPELYLGQFDAVASETLDPQSPLYAFEPQVIIIAQWLEALSPALTTRFLATPVEQRLAEYERVRAHMIATVSALRSRTRAPILLNNWPLPAYPTLGVLDAQSSHYQTRTLLGLNADVLADVAEFGDVWVVDMLRAFATVGYEHARDDRSWQVARAPIAQKALVPLGREYGKFFAALRGKTRKCLVLDCDNTLWGGIVGEDGLSGITIGSTYPGSCFLALQEEVLNLQARGVILALCSKNNESDVLEVLRSHPDMLLREEHFATWEINWDDKATNLRRIATTLNISTDSLVLVDDSRFEIDLVRDLLPEVETIALPVKEYSSYRKLIASCGLFDGLAFTAEDRKKTTMYVDERRRRELRGGGASLTDYLQSLKIQVEIARPGAIEIPRVAQLTQKTNQFNLTTRRYSEADIRGFLDCSQDDVIILKVRDAISDLGLVGAAIVRSRGDYAEIDTFLLSCRVIGRGVEDALLGIIVDRAFGRGGVRRIRGAYYPTSKNSMVESFYARHGFSVIAETEHYRTYELMSTTGHSIECPAWLEIRTGDERVAHR